MRTKNEKANTAVIEQKNLSVKNPAVKNVVSIPSERQIIKPVLTGNQKQSIVVNEKINVPIMKQDIESTLILKSGATDLRRGAEKLVKDNITKIGDPQDGNIRGYINKPGTTIKLVKQKPEKTSMVTIHYKKPIEWPEYQPSDKPGHTVTLQGEEKAEFLKEIGCPEDL